MLIGSYLAGWRRSAIATTVVQREHSSDVDDEANLHRVAQFKPFGLAHPRLDRHDVLPIFREEGCLPCGSPDMRPDRNHAPAVGHQRGSRVERAALLVRHGDEVPRRRALPEPDLATELEVHRIRIGATRLRQDPTNPDTS